MLKERVREVKSMIPKGTNLELTLSNLKKYVKLNNSNVAKLILYSFFIIEKHMETITDEKVHALNRSFCTNHLRELFMLCNGY